MVKAALPAFHFPAYHSAESATVVAPPYPAAPDLPKGKRLTWFSGRFAPLRTKFACHPYSGGRINPLCFPADNGLSISYELLKEKFNKSIFPAGAAFFTALFFFR